MEQELDPVSLLTEANRLGGKHGVGRVDIVENRFVGMKSRGVYETPGGTLLHHAHRAVESITLDREVAHLRDELIPRYAEMVYNGFWFAPERRALQAFMDDVQKRVNGEARLRLYKGSVAIEGRRSEKYDLYDQATATFEQDEVYDQADAGGFIRLNALQTAANWRGTARGGGMTPENSSGGEPQAPQTIFDNLWGGRFREAPADVMWRFTVDHTDRRLLEIDVEGSSLTWRCSGRWACSTTASTPPSQDGLTRILTEARDGSFVFLDTDEDVHSAVERRLVELVGGGRREASHRAVSQRSDGPRSAVVSAASRRKPGATTWHSSPRCWPTSPSVTPRP